MTRLENTFEGYGSSGIAITTGNSGGASGNAFDVVTVNAGSILESASSAVGDGGLRSMRVNGAATELAYAAWTTSMGTKTEIWGRMYVGLTAFPTSATRIFGAYTATRSAALQLSAAGKINLYDAGGTSQAVTTSSLNIGLSRVEFHFVLNATTGLLEVKLFLTNPQGTTPDETKTTAATLSTGANATGYRFGRSETGSGATGDYWLDAVAIDDTGYIGPYSAPSTDVYPKPIMQNKAVIMDSFR